MEKKLMWLAVIIILALGLTYATLYIGYDFRWGGWNRFRLIVKVDIEVSGRGTTVTVHQTNRKQW